MFATEYYTLVAGLREYALDAETKGFDAQAVMGEILGELSAADARQVRLLAAYYDCENLIALREGRAAWNPLGNFSKEELAEELKKPSRLPEALARVVKAYGTSEGEEDEDAETADVPLRFERALFAAYYDLCSRSSSRFLREWSAFDRTLRNVVAAVTARNLGRPVEEVTVGGGSVVEQLQRSSASDFGLRGELDYVDAVLAAVSDEQNLVEKERKVDLIRWNEALELATFDYFDIDAILSYAVRIGIVARWSRLDAARGREMFDRLLAELDGRQWIEKQ